MTTQSASRVRRFYWRHIRRHDGEICGACGRPVDRSTGALSYWTAPDALWNGVEGSESGIRCIPCFTADCRAKGIPVSWVPDATVRDLLAAIRPIITAHKSDTGHVKADEITAAWRAYDDVRRVLA